MFSIIFFPLVSLVNVTWADVEISSGTVSFTSDTKTVGGTVPIGLISYEVDVTLTCEITYSATTDGVLPPSSTIHLSVAPKSAVISGCYRIDSPLLSDMDGNYSYSLPPEDLTKLLGGSPLSPIEIADGLGTIEITIHGVLIVNITPDTGSVNLNPVEWNNFETKDIIVTANVEKVILTVESTYQFSLTATVSMVGFGDTISKEIPVQDVTGNDATTVVVPEFSSLNIILVILTATFIMVVLMKTGYSKSKENKLKINSM